MSDLGFVADGEGCFQGGFAAAGPERHGQIGVIQTVVGERKVRGPQVVDRETGIVFEELQFVDDTTDGMRIGGKIDPRLLVPLSAGKTCVKAH